MAASTTAQLRYEFFKWVFEENQGYACIATAERENPRKTFKQHFFHFPTQLDELSNRVDYYARTRHLWFCVNLFEKAERKKEFAIPMNVVWADLDTCSPEDVSPEPTLVIQSSPDRYQALWKLSQVVAPEVAEDYSRRIAYKYVTSGVDPSGWDLTQLLRVPFTINFKYMAEPLVVVLPDVDPNAISPEIFEKIEPAPSLNGDVPDDSEMPTAETLPDVEKVIYKYAQYLEKSFHELYTIEPDLSSDWSARMYKLINLAFEAGMERDEVFAVGLTAKCNKYLRDRRPLRYLWREVLKVEALQQQITTLAGGWEPLLMPELVEFGENTHDTFIDRYVRWASDATDASPIFHELLGAMLLSSVLADKVRLDTSSGSLVPNLWAMILGESTLARKTTVMNMAMDIMFEVDPDAFLASDGSAEGLITALSHRSGRISIYHRDEVSGFIREINKHTYLSGMPEMLTKLYDSPRILQRILRKEVITVNSPVFVFIAGGIRDAVYANVNEDYILSGFLPRFLVVAADEDWERYKPTGPPVIAAMAEREKLVNELLDLREQYSVNQSMRVLGQTVDIAAASDRPLTQGILSPDAWQRFEKIERQLLETARTSYYKSLAMPVFERLSKSLLKLALLLAASRQTPEMRSFPVEDQDIINSATFIQAWGRNSIDLMLSAGKTARFKELEKIRTMIDSHPGIGRSEIMRATRLDSEQLTQHIINLVDRGEVKRERKGRSERFWIIH
jgi:hypothetical protein